MTTYAISSVNGCYQSLQNLLASIAFDPEQDYLWFVGNLVNTGPDSLAVLRFVKGLGKKAVTVLGKEELHLLRLADGFMAAADHDTLDELLHAPDRAELLQLLRRRPLIHHDSKLNYTLVHAGIPLEWSFSQALTFAYEVESVLAQNNSYPALLENLIQDQSRWSPKLRGWRRLRFILNALTLMRYCSPAGKLDFVSKGPISAQADDLLPWYRLPERLTTQLNIIFADDAGFDDAPVPGIYPLGKSGQLSALSLTATPEMFSVSRVEAGVDRLNF